MPDNVAGTVLAFSGYFLSTLSFTRVNASIEGWACENATSCIDAIRIGSKNFISTIPFMRGAVLIGLVGTSVKQDVEEVLGNVIGEVSHGGMVMSRR